MRKQILIPMIVVTAALLATAYYLSHRAPIPAPVAKLSKTAVTSTSRPPRTEVVAASQSVRPQTQLVFAESRQKDVRLGTIRTIVDVKADYMTRQKAVRALPRNLSVDNCKPLMAFLASVHLEDSVQAGHVIKNDIMDALIRQKLLDRGLAQLLINIYQDNAQKSVIRDYALQHLALLNERFDDPSASAPGFAQTQQKLIQETLWQAAEGRASSLAGTALLGLIEISEAHPELDRARLGQAAIRLTDSTVNEPARVTAFQVCARLDVDGALACTVKAAQADSSSIVRTSAIAALGLFGNADAIPVLSQIAQNNPRFRTIAGVAIKRIQERTH